MASFLWKTGTIRQKQQQTEALDNSWLHKFLLELQGPGDMAERLFSEA